MAGLILAACDDQSDKQDEKTSGRRKVQVQREDEKAWLEADSTLSPARWLASRTAPDGKPDPDAVAQADRLLSEADQIYLEDARMVANRTLQLTAMLQDIGLGEDPMTILKSFVALPAEKDGVRSYSKVCELYFNLRRQGQTPALALAVLRQER